MKKLIHLAILFLIFYSIRDLKAQRFSFTPFGPNNVHYPGVDGVNMRAIVKNNSISIINFRFARIVNNMPVNWFTAMGYDLSYTPFTDTISLPHDPPFQLNPNHTDTSFFIYFWCPGTGLGTSIVRMYNTDDPTEFVQDTFKVRIGNVSITQLSTYVTGYGLSQNYPNPFNPITNINFSIPQTQIVTMQIFDILGNLVETVIDKNLISAGKHNVEFNGSGLSSGVYYYTLSADGFVETKKMILLK